MSFLQFDFNGKSLCFCRPQKIIQTRRLNEVVSCFLELQQAIEKGYYIAGYVAYEAAPAFVNFLQTHPETNSPLLWFGIYKAPIVNNKNFSPITEQLYWQLDTSFEDYQQAIQTIHQQIKAGNVYQVNYTVRLTSSINLTHSYALYKKICQAQQANYCAFLDMGEYQLLSASPELFFHWKEGIITTKPMKGTIARGKNVTLDQQQGCLLANSTKDQAENLMIVDLLRNDLSKIARLNSIQVPQLFTVEKYPTLFQMTSTIKARTKANTHLLNIFQALFPCGSITGAPKASAMEIINNLEKTARRAYCGTIGFVTPQQEAIFNVAIRTIEVHTAQARAYYGVGGGVTWDSSDKNEYQEILTKAKVLTAQPLPKELLESLLLADGRYFLLPLHIRRLQQSANYFNFVFNYSVVKKQLMQLAAQYPQGIYKVRLLLSQIGNCECQLTNINPLKQPLNASWSPIKMNSQNIFIYHKTSTRDFYPTVTLEKEYLLLNERDEITEFVNGNIVILKQHKWLTPPPTSGLLAGTLRQWLVNKKYLTEQVLFKEDIDAAEQIIFINSVRGARLVNFHIE